MSPLTNESEKFLIRTLNYDWQMKPFFSRDVNSIEGSFILRNPKYLTVGLYTFIKTIDLVHKN